MKKILLTGLSVSFGLGVFAQTLTDADRINQINDLNAKKVTTSKSIPVEKQSVFTNRKNTRANSEWFSYYDAVNDTTNTANFFAPMWRDSLVKVRYSNGLFNADMTTCSSIFNPKANMFYNPIGELYQANTFQVTPTNAYSIDSIRIFGNYFRKPTKTNIVDTLRFVYTKNTDFFTGANLNTCNYYIDAVNYPGFDVDFGVGIADTPITRMPNLDPNKMQMEGTGTIVKDIILNNASYPDSNTTTYFSIPTNLAMAANGFAMSSVTFVSGDTYVNGDTIGAFNRFRPLTNSFVDLSGNEVAPKYIADDRNENGTANSRAVTFAANSIGYNFYISAMFNTGRDANNKVSSGRNQYIDIEYKVTCPTCGFVSINDIKNQVSVAVSPNPASDVVKFDMNFNQSFKATTITLTNMTGQIVKTVQLGNVSANSTKGYMMNVADLSKGLYIYTITADGKSQSGKLSVN
jgi:Secretion system C-terminal sorting domain